MMIIYWSASNLGWLFMLLNYLFWQNLHRLPDIRCMDDRLAITLNGFCWPIICPYLCWESISGTGFRLIIYQHHALSDFSSAILEPFLSKGTKIYRKWTHLTCSNLPNWNSFTMNTFNFNFSKPSIVIWSKHQLLSHRYLSFDHHTRKYLFSIFC